MGKVFYRLVYGNVGAVYSIDYNLLQDARDTRDRVAKQYSLLQIEKITVSKDDIVEIIG